MGMHYSHFLLATNPNLAPEPGDIAAFLEAMKVLGALPIDPTIQLRKHTGKSITGRNAYTGETLEVSLRTNLPVNNLQAVPETLASEPDYDLVLAGDGPEPLKPFPIYEADKVIPWTGPYFLQLSCSLRPADTPVQSFDPNPSDPEFHRLGRSRLFPPSRTRPRFWIAFELGKWLHPQARGEVLIAPAILRAASTAFATDFTEGWTFN